MNPYLVENRRREDIGAILTRFRIAIQKARMSGVSDEVIADIIKRAHASPNDPALTPSDNKLIFDLACLAWKLKSYPLSALLAILDE